MKKIILVGMMLVGAMTFAEKITTKNRPWNEIMKYNENTENYSGTWVNDLKRIDGNPEYGDNTRYVFDVLRGEDIVGEKRNGKWYLYVTYETRESAGGDEIDEFSEDGTDEMKMYESLYIIHPTNQKGIYYVNNFVDKKGKKHPKLYFGFDEKLKKMVITDKDGNILEKMDMVIGD